MRAAFALTALVLVACGSAQPAAVTVPLEPAPSAPSASAEATTSEPDPSAPVVAAAGPQAPLPPALTCDAGPGPAIKSPARDKAPPPVAGQMTEQAAQAKRLFDGEKWKDAVNAMRRVANGETGDDEGNKQLAEYHAAIALFRLGSEAESYQAFSAIAKRSSHIKHAETILWISKVAVSHPEHLVLSDLATYTPDDVARFNNSNQLVVYQSLSFLLGRERLAEGKTAEARTLLGQVPDGHPYASAAKKCLASSR